jgi:NhaP-type Na+/H+ or K+/H+ antiporter
LILILGAFLTRFTKHAPIIEPLLVYACAYLAYLTAEWIQLSSILAIVFAGFFMRSFVEDNMPQSFGCPRFFFNLKFNLINLKIP